MGCGEYRPSKRSPAYAGPLRWPRSGDHRRAIVGQLPSLGRAARKKQYKEFRIVHASYWDLEVYDHFGSARSTGRNLPMLDDPVVWNPVEMEPEHHQLFQYFQNTASKSIAVFGYDATEIGSVLVRTALSSTSTSAAAVLQSLLAFAALHRYGLCSQSMDLKLSAINSLGTPTGCDIGATEAIQHVAASMLLVSFEVHQSSCTSGDWTCYLSGAKQIIQTAKLHELSQDRDIAVLLDWVYYHDVLGRFSLRHWHRQSLAESTTLAGIVSSSSNLSSNFLDIRAKASQTPKSASAAINLLSDICDTLSIQDTPRTFANYDQDWKGYLTVLDWRIRQLAGKVNDAGSPQELEPELELYQLALQIYINRASGDFLDQATRTQQQIKRAFAIISQLQSCDRQFAVFILGCEARSDEQRAEILGLISRAEGQVSSRSWNHPRRILQGIWVQDELADGHVDYRDRLSRLISCCRIPPSFV